MSLLWKNWSRRADLLQGYKKKRDLKEGKDKSKDEDKDSKKKEEVAGAAESKDSGEASAETPKKPKKPGGKDSDFHPTQNHIPMDDSDEAEMAFDYDEVEHEATIVEDCASDKESDSEGKFDNDEFPWVDSRFHTRHLRFLRQLRRQCA